jgi:hypothetical protein
MVVLFDNNTPRTLARYLIAHDTITEGRARGWGEMENGDLLDAAEAAGFEVFVTAGQKHPSMSRTSHRGRSPSLSWAQADGA